jgi:hypothetical protein
VFAGVINWSVAERFDMAVRQIVGKRLTYDQLIGKTADAPPCAD